MDPLRNVLERSEKEGAAFGHFNVADLVILKAVVAAARENRVPVLVGASEGERDFFGTRQLSALVKSLREESDGPLYLNADHTHSLESAIEAAKAGFDSVVVDFSALPFEQNVSRTKEAVEALKAVNPSIPGRGGDRKHWNRLRDPPNGSERGQEPHHTSGGETIRPLNRHRCPRPGGRQHARHA
jgi:fructose-bisphosphate aldolase class II